MLARPADPGTSDCIQTTSAFPWSSSATCALVEPVSSLPAMRCGADQPPAGENVLAYTCATEPPEASSSCDHTATASPAALTASCAGPAESPLLSCAGAVNAEPAVERVHHTLKLA